MRGGEGDERPQEAVLLQGNTTITIYSRSLFPSFIWQLLIYKNELNLLEHAYTTNIFLNINLSIPGKVVILNFPYSILNFNTNL